MQVLIAMQVLESSGKANCKRGKARNLKRFECFRPVSDLFQTCSMLSLFLALTTTSSSSRSSSNRSSSSSNSSRSSSSSNSSRM